MIFSTFQFIFIFLPLVFFVYWLCLRLSAIPASKWWLVASSLYFYYAGSQHFFPFFAASVVFNYLFGMLLARISTSWAMWRRRCMLTIGILANVFLLGYFKYADFAITNYNFFVSQPVDLLHIVLPIGISFFTFQLIAFLVDSHRGETKDYTFLNYLLFITFFPQLIVGPIVHHKEMVAQYENQEIYRLNPENIAKGLFLFSIGCAKKILIADNLTPLAQAAFDHAQELSMLESWASSFSYTVSYYFDLSGYADMAIGLGLIFNIMLPLNFNSPYRSRDFAEYWRRWHMTLSRFLGNYIFRNVYRKGGSSQRFYLAVMVTFFVSGFWHGAGWNFVVWGIINGMFVAMAHMMTRAGRSLPLLAAWGLTFAGVVFTRILFVSKNIEDAVYVAMTHFDFSKFHLAGNDFIGGKQPFLILLGLLIAIAGPNSNELVARFYPNLKSYALVVALLTISILSMNSVGDFLYFQF